jgi:hypothetical protein
LENQEKQHESEKRQRMMFNITKHHMPGIPDISIRHKPELKDGALALSKKGTIRITHYEDSSQR